MTGPMLAGGHHTAQATLEHLVSPLLSLTTLRWQAWAVMVCAWKSKSNGDFMLTMQKAPPTHLLGDHLLTSSTWWQVEVFIRSKQVFWLELLWLWGWWGNEEKQAKPPFTDVQGQKGYIHGNSWAHMGISEHLWVWSVGMCPYSPWWCWWQGENRRNVCGHDKTVALPQGMAHALCCTVQAER